MTPEYRTREIDDFGTITFASEPAGFVTPEGWARKRDYRAYHFQAAGECETCHGQGRDFRSSAKGKKCGGCNGAGVPKRQRMVSVTTALGAILPKDALVPWAEARGIEGAIQAVRHGLVDPDDPASAENAVSIVRAERLGADAARDQAATRGVNVHDIIERWCTDGEIPNPADYDPDHHGYIQAASRWILANEPEMEAVELMVCSPEDGFAGRLDFLGTINGVRALRDFKTSATGAIYNSAHLQLAMLERGMAACGDGPVEDKRVVALAADGSFKEMECLADQALVDVALEYLRLLKPVTSACDAANRAEREARRVAA